MYTKSLFLVLLGCTLILASPVQESHKTRSERSILGTFANWMHKADEAVDSVYDRVKQPFVKVYNAFVSAGEGVADYSKEKLDAVLKKYYELKSQSEEKLNNIKNVFLTKAVDQLQKVIDALEDEKDQDTLEKLKEKTKQLADSGYEALAKLQKQLQEAIEAEKEKLNEEFKKWEKEANEAVEKNQSAEQEAPVEEKENEVADN